MMHGKGAYCWADGRKYSGQYFCNAKHGYGVFTWPDGSRYEGTFLNGKRHGKAKYYLPDGKWREGVWDLDKRLKWISETMYPNQQFQEQKRAVSLRKEIELNEPKG